MKDLYKQISDEEFVKDIAEEDCKKIEDILKELKYNRVIWVGSVYMVGNVFMGWDLEFYDDASAGTCDSIREFQSGSPTKDKMEQVLSILLENRIEFGMEIYYNAP